MDKIIPISDLQSKAKKYVDQVRETSEPLVITQRGRAAAVLVNYEDFEGLAATRDEMSFPDWKRKLARARKDAREGRVISLEKYLERRRKKGR